MVPKLLEKFIFTDISTENAHNQEKLKAEITKAEHLLQEIDEITLKNMVDKIGDLTSIDPHIQARISNAQKKIEIISETLSAAEIISDTLPNSDYSSRRPSRASIGMHESE